MALDAPEETPRPGINGAGQPRWRKPMAAELPPDEATATIERLRQVRMGLVREVAFKLRSDADASKTIAFLQQVHPAGPWLVCAFGANEEVGPAATFMPGEEKQLRALIDASQGEWNIYFSVNAVSMSREWVDRKTGEVKRRGRLKKKALKADIEEIRYLHVDADLNKELDWSDPAAVEAEKARVLAKLRAYKPPPSIITWSGGGYQGFWRLSENHVVNGDREVMKPFEGRMEVIRDAFEADACQNVDRVMRLPGTINVLGKTKIDAGRMPDVARLIEHHADRIYDLEEFPKPAREPERPKKEKANAAAGAGMAGGHDRAEYQRARSALQAVPNEDRDVWLKIGMALKDAFSELGYGLWLDWAQTCSKYDSEDSRRVWESLSNGGTTIATLFWMARTNGWRDVPESTDAGQKPAAEDVPPHAPMVSRCVWTALKTPPKPRIWHLEHWMPGDDVTGLWSDGGIGKTTLGMQLGYCTAGNMPFLGMPVRAGGAFYLTAEEHDDEIDFRNHQIANGIIVPESAIRHPFEVVSRASEDALLCRFSKSGVIEPTPLWKEIIERIGDLKCAYVGIDPSADVFGGNEIDRAQVRAFVNMLRKPAIEHKCAILLMGHASVDGMKTGRGYSGSTAWNNSVRARWYFQRPPSADGSEDDDTDLRELSLKKTNRGKPGQRLLLNWHGGWFGLDGGAPQQKGVGAIEVKVKFMKLLTSFTDEQKRNVCHKPNANNYAPTMFAKSPDGKPHRKADYEKAMEELFSEGRLRIKEYGPPSRRWERLEPT
jgi:RecA-family ATPase